MVLLAADLRERGFTAPGDLVAPDFSAVLLAAGLLERGSTAPGDFDAPDSSALSLGMGGGGAAAP